MSARIEDLEPVTRGLCVQFLAACEANAAVQAAGGVRVTHTRRTLDEQLHLYAKGRAFRVTADNPQGEWVVVDRKAIVTKAPPGSSAHNYGAAFDICFNAANPYPDPETPAGKNLWQIVGAIGERIGLNWGGPLGAGDRFTFDCPHFERRDWRTLRTA